MYNKMVFVSNVRSYRLMFAVNIGVHARESSLNIASFRIATERLSPRQGGGRFRGERATERQNDNESERNHFIELFIAR